MALKSLIVGYGSIAKRHAKNLKSLGFKDILVCDTNPARVIAAQSDLGAKAFDSLEQALLEKPDIAFICTPPNSHIPVAKIAAKQHCHLFIEKPLSNEYSEIDSLLKLVEEHNLITMVGCNLRFHPGLIEAKNLLGDGKIGKIVSARVEFGQYLPDWHPAEDYRKLYVSRKSLGGGVILDVIHEIDYIRWLMGDVESVVCFADKLSHLEMETEDIASMLFRFKSGAVGEVHVDCIQRVYNRTCEIIGDEGTIHWDYSKRGLRWYSAATKEWTFAPVSSSWEPNQMYIDELSYFLKCVQHKEKTVLDLNEAARVLKIALTAKESVVSGEVLKV